MNRSFACLRSYVAAWWMKVIAAVVLLVAVNGMLFLWSRPIWEPAWPHPHLASSFAIQGGWASTSLDALEGLEAKADCFQQPPEKTRELLRSLPRLRYCRVDVPYDTSQGPHADARQQSVDVFFEELQRLPELEAIELTARTPVEVLEPLRGNPRIRHVYTTPLYANDAARADDWFAALVDSVVALPRLEVWGLPVDTAQRLGKLDPERLAVLRQHPTLHTLLVPPERMGWPLADLVCHKLLPEKQLAISHIDRGRLSAAWGVLAVTMMVSALVIVSAAGMLVVSAASVAPGYAPAHRRVVGGLLAVITAVAAVALCRVDVALLPALLWAAFSAIVPAAMLEWDRRRTIPGILVLPFSLAWCVGFLVPISSIDRGWWWVWFDQFLDTNLPTPTTWGVLVAVVLLTGIAWRAVGLYTVSLAERGRSSALVTSRVDVWQQIVRGGGLPSSDGGSLWGSAPAIAGPALRLDRLSSCDTAAGCRQLLAEGMLTIPRGRLLVQGAIIVVLAPLFMSFAVPAFRENPLLLAAALGAIALAAVWLRPVMLWHERALRLPCEIGGVLARPRYVAALRGLLARQMLIPTFTLFVAGAVLLMWKTGEGWRLLPLAGLIVGLSMTVVSVCELTLTLRSPVLKFVVAFGAGYGGVVAGAMGFASLVMRTSWGPADSWRFVPFVVLGVLAVGLRLWMNRRINRFEFGRLV